MVYDDLVIGSGIAALGVVLGLDPRRRVLMISGPAVGGYAYYDARRLTPAAYRGFGGLGNDWHGVIPLSLQANFAQAQRSDFTHLFERFYPRAGVGQRLGTAQVFVPWKPIRPRVELQRHNARHPGTLTILHESVASLRIESTGLAAVTAGGVVHRARRGWIAAGVLQTPFLLDDSLDRQVSTGFVSDHVHSYIGLVQGVPPPAIERTPDGVFFQCYYAPGAFAQYSLRPARFGFRKLDFGVEQRSVFGMPTGSAVAKIVRRMSPGLLAEAIYNRTGAFARAGVYSVYGQTPATRAYRLGRGDLPFQADPGTIRAAVERCAAEIPFADVQMSRRLELHMPGIHLHGSVDLAALQAAGLNVPGAHVQVVDASTVDSIGPDHHSFKIMLAAFGRARAGGDA